jgi:HEAT repeat protein
MSKSNIIEFESKKRLLQKAGAYIESLELFFEEQDRAVPLLLKILKDTDSNTMHKIVLLLGSFAKQEVALPFYLIMKDPEANEETRHTVSIQLSVIFPFLKDPQPLIDKLLEDIRSSDSELKCYAAFALGWEGNTRAGIPLIELLYDKDPDVQQTAVNALSNLRDDRILGLMLERLEHGALEQKRCILFNLWRFYSKQDEVVDVYLKYLNHDNPDLRLDALALLGIVSDNVKLMPIYGKCLQDSNSRVRCLALKQIGEAEGIEVVGLEGEISKMLSDPDMEVKKEALNILKKIDLKCGVPKV